MRKVLRVGAIVAAFALTAWIGVVALAQGSSTPTPSPSTTTTTTTTASPSPSPSGVDDVKGNCDEAEHANDPECKGVTPVAEDDDVNDDQAEDINDDHGDDINDDDQGENDDDHGDDVNDDDQGRTRTTTTRTTTRVRAAPTPVLAAPTPVRAAAAKTPHRILDGGRAFRRGRFFIARARRLGA